MPDDRGHYEIYYADKLWKLLPAVYRSADTSVLGKNGPLRELVNRIGAQAAILRRSIDRLWEDQSIETCDDWLIPYIADLLATNLVASLDARGQRLDVAKTIYYRRRKGTLAILEEIAADITGWDARVVEFFRRMGRTRHEFDPEIGLPSATDDPVGNRALQLTEGLVGPLTNTAIGGWANLRNIYGASKAQTAFDEFFHTADFRKGRGQVGWHNIPRLGVFLWRLKSFPPNGAESVEQITPVPVLNSPDDYSFDPTGREVPLFAVSSRAFGDNWISPQEWQLPTPIARALLRAALADPVAEPLYAVIDPVDGVTLHPNSLGVFTKPGSFYELIDASQVTAYPEAPNTTHEVMIFPECGRLRILHPPLNGPLSVTYHYGFSSTIGAGLYDRRLLGQQPNASPDPAPPVTGGGSALAAPLGGVVPVGTVTIGDSLTYDMVTTNVAGIQQVTIIAENTTRPVIRPPSPNTTQWTFSGTGSSRLVLDGLFVSGGDIVLSGIFDSVTLTCCTFDPGNSGESTVFAKSVDGRDLIPTRLWVEGQVRLLQIDRCILGPIRTRANGEIESVTATDSIVQGIRTSDFGPLTVAQLKDPTRLASRLRDARDPLSRFIQGRLSPGTQPQLSVYNSANPPSPALQQALVQDLNALLAGPSLYDANRFALVHLTSATMQRIAQNPTGTDLARLNRMLLEQGYPIELADLSLALSSGVVNLSRCTLLGPANVHRLEASQSIVDDVVLVEDAQHGCVRFSAWTMDSVLPRQYESVKIPPYAPLFTTRAFGQPGYAQLLQRVDSAIVSGLPGATISEGAEDGSEMGAFAREKNPIKEHSLLIKYKEFMPLGLVPVVIYAT